MIVLGAKLVYTPIEKNSKLSYDIGELLHDPGPYRRLIGCLIYITIIRPILPLPSIFLVSLCRHHANS